MTGNLVAPCDNNALQPSKRLAALPITAARKHTAQAVIKTATPKKPTSTALAVANHLSPLQIERVTEIDLMRSGLELALSELERTGNVRPFQQMQHEMTKLNRIRRDIARESPALAQTFLDCRASEAELLRKQQRMLNDLDESEALNRRNKPSPKKSMNEN